MPLRYQEVKQEIKKIISGLKSGSRIPSRNFLSRKYEVARNTVDKAIAELEEEGYLRCVKGSGTYVSGMRMQKMLNVGVILPSIMGSGLGNSLKPEFPLFFTFLFFLFLPIQRYFSTFFK